MNTTKTTSPMETIMLRWASRIESRVVMVRSLGDLETDRRRKLSLKLRHQSLNPRDRVDDVRIGLAVDLDLNHRIAVYDAEVPDILIPVDDAAEVREADGRAVPVDHHQILVFLRQEKLVGGINRNLDLGVCERAFRLVRIGALEERADLIETHVVARRAAADSLRREPREASFHPPKPGPRP